MDFDKRKTRSKFIRIEAPNIESNVQENKSIGGEDQ